MEVDLKYKDSQETFLSPSKCDITICVNEVNVDPPTFSLDCTGNGNGCEMKPEATPRRSLAPTGSGRKRDLLATPRPRRSSSMKVPRNPSDHSCDTRDTSKGVRFADALGLELTKIVQILNPDCPPVVPDSARRDLHLEEQDSSSDEKSLSTDSSSSSFSNSSSFKCSGFHSIFKHPIESPDFIDRLSSQNICLCSAHFDVMQQRFYGTLKVKNLSFEKSVFARGSFNYWNVYMDYPATFSCDEVFREENVDTFYFCIYVPPCMEADNFQFCLCYKTNDGREYWDNNQGCNYVFQRGRTPWEP